MKSKNYLASLFFLLAPSISFQQNTMEIFLQNQKLVNVDNKKCRAGYSNNKFYASCNGSEVKDDYLLGKVAFSYVIAREIENLNSHILSDQVSRLENVIDKSILYETGKMLYRTANSFDSDMPWWTGTVNATAMMYVDPKFYARTFVGNTGREAIRHQINAINLIKQSEQHTALSYEQYKNIYEELMISYPIIEPLTEFANSVNRTTNPAFAIDKKELEEFKKIKFQDENSHEIKAIRENIIRKIKNTPEFINYRAESDRRLYHWQNLRYSRP